MNCHVEMYKLWYEFLLRGDTARWSAEVKQAFGSERLPVEVWWRRNNRNFPETDRLAVRLIRSIREFEPNDEVAFNVEVYCHHPKHHILKALEKLVKQHQKRWNINPIEEYIQFANLPLEVKRKPNKAMIRSLKTTLRIWDSYCAIQKEQEAEGIRKKPDLYEVWKRARTKDTLVFKDVMEDPMGMNVDANRATVRPHISRYMKWAKALIGNAEMGVFPKHSI